MTAVTCADNFQEAATIFSDVHQLVVPELKKAASQLSGLRSVAGYHFGWTDAHGRPVDTGGGKMIRAALAITSARAAGGPAMDGVPAAVAIELVHNHSLLHDDVIDQDVLRRHRKTVWSVFGVPTAILLGDALLCRAFQVISDRRDVSATSTHLLSQATERMILGQHADMELEARTEPVSMEECVAMVGAKTAALMGCACALGALYGGASSDLIRHMNDFGEDLGMAFQFADDLLGIWGDPARTGKPARSDLQRRKKSLPVAFALSNDSPVAQELTALYQLPRELSTDELDRAAELIEECGARAWAQREADRYTSRALENVPATELNPPALQQLSILAGLVNRREH